MLVRRGKGIRMDEALRWTRFASGQIVAPRTVVDDLGEVLLVCRREEFDQAALERRIPTSIGFKKTDLAGS